MKKIDLTQPYLVKKQTAPIHWKVAVPGSKSMTNRALLLAALSDGAVELSGVLFSDDSRHFISCLQALGFETEVQEEKKCVRILGCNGRIPKKEAVIDVGSAGTAARFLTAMLGFSEGSYVINASEQMKRRPMLPLFELLQEAGAKIEYLEQAGCLPVRIKGAKNRYAECSEAGKPLELSLDISKSTQFLSALLLVSPMIKQGLKIHITSEKTDGSYIRITRKMMQEAGATVFFEGRNYEVPRGTSYHMENYTVEPDMSAACYFYAAAAVTGGRALVENVHKDNTQGDMKFLTVLEKMGCTVTEEPEGIVVSGPADGRINGLSVDMNDFSDQALTLAALAPFANDVVRIKNIAHIRQQESDRIHAIVTELTRLGIRCEEEADAVTIYPGEPKGGLIKTYEDHRVAMAFSLIGLRTDGIRIDNPGCCGKTFEEYFAVLSELTEQQ